MDKEIMSLLPIVLLTGLFLLTEQSHLNWIKYIINKCNNRMLLIFLFCFFFNLFSVNLLDGEIIFISQLPIFFKIFTSFPCLVLSKAFRKINITQTNVFVYVHASVIQHIWTEDVLLFPIQYLMPNYISVILCSIVFTVLPNIIYIINLFIQWRIWISTGI